MRKEGDTMIRKARPEDLDAVVAVYDEILTAEEAGLSCTGWIRGLYPDRSVAGKALARDDLFVIEEDGCILGSGIINHFQGPEYASAPWEYEADPDHVCVLHTLTVSPRAGGRGLGRQFVAFYEVYAKKNGCRELRIDTNERNRTAQTMYAKLGYKVICIVPTVFNGITNVRMVIMEKYLEE